MIRLAPLSLAVLAATAAAQPNTVPGMDVRMDRVFGLTAAGRLGNFPDGRNGLALATTVCNIGSVQVTFLPSMDPRHPKYGFVLCRERTETVTVGGNPVAVTRFVQVSDRSFVKHAFSAANRAGCGPCVSPGSTMLGLGCSDTYRVQANQNRFNLGPPAEIDPWLGTWDPRCSHFDRGEPPVAPPADCDGVRSLVGAQTNAMDPVTHRVEVDDADLLGGAGERYFYGSYVVIEGEAEALRDDNMASMETRPTWSVDRWAFAEVGKPVLGTILRRWTGARIESATNGNDDGRLYVAAVVTGPDTRGLWRYEYAVHNRDNRRAASALRIPICADARVFAPSFRDVDGDPASDWQMTVAGGEVVFAATSAQNALEWNTIYNFGFTSDAAPVDATLALDQARPGTGAAAVTVTHVAPAGTVRARHLGDGCGQAELWPTGNPPFATIPNDTFGLLVTGAAAVAPVAFVLGSSAAPLQLGPGCTLHVGPPVIALVGTNASPLGDATLPLRIPARTGLEGFRFTAQGVVARQGGPLQGLYELTSGLEITVGNAVPVCR